MTPWEGRMAIHIGRREFVTLLGGAAAWPLAARAQQRERMRRGGMMLPPEDAGGQARVGACLQELAQCGWAIGRNLRIDIRWDANAGDNHPARAAELVALAPDVIVTHGAPAATPWLQPGRVVRSGCRFA